jgi:hypothetical protein
MSHQIFKKYGSNILGSECHKIILIITSLRIVFELCNLCIYDFIF